MMIDFSRDVFLKRPFFGEQTFNMRNNEMTLIVSIDPTSPPICFAIPIMIDSFLFSLNFLLSLLLLSCCCLLLLWVSVPLCPQAVTGWWAPPHLIGRRLGPDVPYPASYFLRPCRNTEVKIHKYKSMDGKRQMQKQTGRWPMGSSCLVGCGQN